MNDDWLKPFPSRDGAPLGGAMERVMLNKAGGPGTIRTVMQFNPDGSTTMLRTRNGMPEFTTIAVVGNSQKNRRTFVFRAIGASVATIANRLGNGFNVIASNIASAAATYLVAPISTALGVKWSDVWRIEAGEFTINGKPSVVTPSPIQLPSYGSSALGVVLSSVSGYAQSLPTDSTRSPLFIGYSDGQRGVTSLTLAGGVLTSVTTTPTHTYDPMSSSGLDLSAGNAFSFYGATLSIAYGMPYGGISCCDAITCSSTDPFISRTNAWCAEWQSRLIPKVTGSTNVATTHTTPSIWVPMPIAVTAMEYAMPEPYGIHYYVIADYTSRLFAEPPSNTQVGSDVSCTFSGGTSSEFYSGSQHIVHFEYAINGECVYTVRQAANSSVTETYLTAPPSESPYNPRPWPFEAMWSAPASQTRDHHITQTIKLSVDGFEDLLSVTLSEDTVYAEEYGWLNGHAWSDGEVVPPPNHTSSYGGTWRTNLYWGDPAVNTQQPNLAEDNAAVLAIVDDWTAKLKFTDRSNKPAVYISKKSGATTADLTVVTKDYVFADRDEGVFLWLEAALTRVSTIPVRGDATLTFNLTLTYVLSIRGVKYEVEVYSGNSFTAPRLTEATYSTLAQGSYEDFKYSALFQPTFVFSPPFMEQGNCPYIAYTTRAEELRGAAPEIYVDFSILPRLYTQQAGAPTGGEGVVTFIPHQLAKSFLYWVCGQNVATPAAATQNLTFWNELFPAATRIQFANGVAGPWSPLLGSAFATDPIIEITRT